MPIDRRALEDAEREFAARTAEHSAESVEPAADPSPGIPNRTRNARSARERLHRDGIDPSAPWILELQRCRVERERIAQATSDSDLKLHAAIRAAMLAGASLRVIGAELSLSAQGVKDVLARVDSRRRREALQRARDLREQQGR